jgi:diguanylate cyclase (GGDEF)-like protein
LLVLVCVLPAAVVSAGLVAANYGLQREQICRDTALLARRISADMDRELAGAESRPRVLAASPDVAAGDLDVSVFQGGMMVYSSHIGSASDRIGDIVSRHGFPDGWVVSVLDGSGTIVARSREAQRLVGQRAMPRVLQYLATHRDGSLETRTGDGAPVIVSFSRSSISDWSVAVTAPKAALEAELYRWSTWVLVDVAVAIGLGLWLAMRLADRVTAAVRGLSAAALALGSGARVELPSIQLKEADAVGEAIVEASRLMEEVSHLARHDGLTGLCNRVLFDELLSHELAAAERRNGALVILAVDLDGFKAVNDRHGHATGDRVLQTAAERIMRTIRAADAAARLGGDEFSVLVVDASLDDAMQTAERLVTVLSKPYPGVEPAVSASVGIAVFPRSGTSAAVLLESADRALYRAKKSGKHCATIDLGTTACGNVPRVSAASSPARRPPLT